jgi:hypothetical protein
MESIIAKINAEKRWIDIKPYSHNIVSSLLLSLSKHLTLEEMRMFVRDSGLYDMGWKGYEKTSEEEYEKRRMSD